MGTVCLAACSSGDRASSAASGANDRGREARPGPAGGEEKRVGSPRRHALVVGGTGMLKQVSLELARRGYTTSVIARSRGPLEDLVRESGGRVNPIALDYRDTAQLSRELEQAVRAHGPIELVVAWIHSVAPDAPLAVARSVAAGGRQVDYFHVLGSAADDPSQPDHGRRTRFAAVPHLVYHEVILGFMIEDGASRWLTHDEIASGILEAIDHGAARRIIGTTRPWSARP